MKPTLLDLFSGIGGFSLAFEQEGFETIGFSEIDPYCCAVLKKHWPQVKNYGDIRNIPKLSVDIITGGFPCQPFSVAGKRKGKADDRYLWPQMVAVIERCQPAWVLGENVPGIINMELDRVLSDLENIGYTAWPLVIPACAVDAPHRRDRVWIVANSKYERFSWEQGRKICEWTTGESKWAGLRSGFERSGKTLAHAESGESRITTKWEGREDSSGGSVNCGRDQEKRAEALGNSMLKGSSPQRNETREQGRFSQPSEDVANANGERRGFCGQSESEYTHAEQGGKTGANTVQQRLQKRQRQNTAREGQESGTESERICIWEPEPNVGRVANGIPARVDRLRCLGNSIVPQIAQIFAKTIYQTCYAETLTET